MVQYDRSFWSRWEVIVLVFIVIVSLIIAGGYVTYNVISTSHSSAASGATVEIGDSVSVDYIGQFEDGTVFDTSIQSVAHNDTMYPKSLAFKTRETYSPLTFTVGQGQMISGFDNGVLGMRSNQTKILTITPEEGYGYPDESLILTKSLTVSVPIFEWIGNSTTFSETYFLLPSVGTNVKNTVYGWNMTVYHIDPITDQVLVKNNPCIGETIQTSEGGWYSNVVSIDTSANKGAGEIVISHQIGYEDVRSRMFVDNQQRQFMITDFNPLSGTFMVDYNSEHVGRTLIFKVTLRSITSA
jgi:FKBP-type peptidyl-prolyl cis-trans isomerase 2